MANKILLLQLSCIKLNIVMKLLFEKSDTIGAIVSFLCFIHCLTLPFIIIAIQTYSEGFIELSPIWWKNLDFFLLLVSFFAVYHSAKYTNKKLMKTALWSSWITLSILIINEKLHWLSFPELGTYFSSLSLAGLHIYNYKFCKCNPPKN